MPCVGVQKCSVRKVTLTVVLVVLIGVGGGLLIWQYVPEKHKESIAEVAQGGTLPISTGREGDAPPPTYIFNQCQDQSNCCNGLDGICDLGVDDIMYAGIHNAQSSGQDGFYLAPNHDYNVIASLEYGYRLLNFDIGVCNGELMFVHTICKLGTSDPTTTFTAINQWLTDNPTEVIVIPLEIVKNAGGSDDVDLGKIYNLLLAIDGFTERMYQKINENCVWPTLGELVANDQRILLFHYNGGVKCSSANVTCPPGFHDWFEFAGETKFEFISADEFDDKASACEITRGRLKGPLYALNAFMNIPSKEIAATTLNTKAFLEDHIQACSEIAGNDVNTVFVDFWDVGDLPEVVQTHNGQLAVAGGQRRKRSLRP